MSEELNLRDDSPVKIIISGKEIDGTIVSVINGILTVAMVQDLGPEISFGRLVVNDSFLIERLRDKLTDIKNGKAPFQHSSADSLFTNSPSVIGEGEVPAAVLSFGNPLNADQLQAVRRSIGSSLVFMWGPPGTGKTSTIAAIVHALYLQGKSILLVSNTNIAVDTALEGDLGIAFARCRISEAAILRFGPIISEELKRKYELQVNLAIK